MDFLSLAFSLHTGQPTTTYTSHFRKARPTAEQMHIVLVDNGRSDWIANPEHWEILKCIRCGSCMNTCPVYRRSGGYSYSYFIPGPVGINLGMLRSPQQHSGNVSACTLCLSCQSVCPVKIDLGDQVYKWRQQLDEFGTANSSKKLMCSAMTMLFDHPSLYKMATAVSPLANIIPPFLMNSSLNPWAEGHEMMKFPKKPFHEMAKDL